MNKNKLPLLAAVSLLIGFAPASHSQSMGDSFEPRPVANISWHPVSRYVSKVCDAVRAQWKPENGEDSDAAVVSFSINKNGSKSSVVLKSSSGDKKLDQAALNAVNNAANCGAVPDVRKLPLKMELAFKTCMPKIQYAPPLDRDVSVVLYVPNDENQIDQPTNYPAKTLELLSQKWNFKAPKTSPGDCFIVRCKLAEDGTIVARKVVQNCSVPGLDDAAMKLLDEIKTLPPPAVQMPKSRFLFLGFEPVTDPVDQQILAYKSETTQEKRFNSLVERAVLAKWRPFNGKPMHGIVHLYLTLNADGTLKKMEWFRKSRNSAENEAAKRAVAEALPIRPPAGSDGKVGIYFDASVDPTTLPVFVRNVSAGGEHISTVSDEKETQKNVEKAKGKTIAQDGKGK